MKLEIKKYSVEILLAVAVIGLALQIVEVAAKPTEQELPPSAGQLAPGPDKPLLIPPQSTVNSPADLGKMLYQNHCNICHESNAHIRANRQAHNRDDITAWVTRWSTYLELKWTDDQIEAVTDHLNTTYYHFAK